MRSYEHHKAQYIVTQNTYSGPSSVCNQSSVSGTILSRAMSMSAQLLVSDFACILSDREGTSANIYEGFSESPIGGCQLIINSITDLCHSSR